MSVRGAPTGAAGTAYRHPVETRSRYGTRCDHGHRKCRTRRRIRRLSGQLEHGLGGRRPRRVQHPAGANPLFCRPSSAHPDPVVLVHGALANQNIASEALALTLANAGYCVFTFTYGQTWYSDTLFDAGGEYRRSM
jgi:hypothetical protein